jgi:hypothetical protein
MRGITVSVDRVFWNEPDRHGGRSAVDVMRFLTPDLVDFLADLRGAPPSIVQATIQLLPFGSRSALLATGLATSRDGAGDATGGGRLELTPLAFEVIAEAAACGDQEEIRMLAARARAVAGQSSRHR